jgi:uncharacterized phage protein (TIGR02220 family)
MADGESVPLSLLAKIGSVSKTQAFRIIQWGKELQGDNSPEIHQKPKEKIPSKSVSVSKDKENDKELISQKVIEVIEYLNLATGKKFSTTGNDNIKHVMKKITEGYTMDNFKQVIDVKTAKWKGTDMEDYLRPQTLFGGKFNAYLNELPNNGKQQTSSSIQQTIDTAQRVAESIDWGVDTE